MLANCALTSKLHIPRMIRSSRRSNEFQRVQILQRCDRERGGDGCMKTFVGWEEGVREYFPVASRCADWPCATYFCRRASAEIRARSFVYELLGLSAALQLLTRNA